MLPESSSEALCMLHQNFVTSGADVTDITTNIDEGRQYFNVYAVRGNETSNYVVAVVAEVEVAVVVVASASTASTAV